MSKQQLLNYLKTVMKLEVYKRTLEETLRHKIYQINNLKKANSIEKPVNMTGGLLIIVLPICLIVGGFLYWGSKFWADDIWGRILLFPVKMLGEYYGAAEPPVRCGESHLSGLTEPPHLFSY